MARLVALLVVLSATWAWGYAAAPPCYEITQMITPCMPYLLDRTRVPYGQCCDGVVALNRAVSTRVDRVATCNCLKSVAPKFPGIHFSRAATLPRSCGVLINITISPSVDCNGYVIMTLIIWPSPVPFGQRGG